MTKESFLFFIKGCIKFFTAPVFMCVIISQLIGWSTKLFFSNDVAGLISSLGVLPLLFVIMFFGNHKWVVTVISKINPWAFAVELISFEGKHYYTFAKRIDEDKLFAHVYWNAKVGEAILNKTGIVDKKSESSYIKWWLPLNNPLREEYILRNDYPDFSELKEYVDRRCPWR